MRWGALALVCLAVLGRASRGSGEVLDSLVARVDAEVVTWSQVVQERELRRLEGAPAAELAPLAVRATLVERHLLVAEARKLRLAVTLVEAREAVATLVQGAEGEALWGQVARLGLDRAQLEERAAQRLLVQRYQSLRREMTFVPEAEVRAAFLRRRGALPEDTLAQARDAVRTQLAERKYREELARWLKQQAAAGRVEWFSLPDLSTP